LTGYLTLSARTKGGTASPARWPATPTSEPSGSST